VGDHNCRQRRLPRMIFDRTEAESRDLQFLAAMEEGEKKPQISPLHFGRDDKRYV
jgi:hypothetical protein